MTREERQYFYNQLYKLFHDWVNEHGGSGAYVKSVALHTFAERYMQTITGQQPLPQTVFRIFLEECAPAITSVEESKQDVIDDNLATKDKTIVGAINETVIHINEIGIAVEGIGEDKQDRVDETLVTEDKVLVSVVNTLVQESEDLRRKVKKNTKLAKAAL